ncbi:hypothetical protein D6833_13070 [Candidatus Parcubacteria bacterium]|nr:MAG: hypothetical protein D6833_13070 [Candidatus Parcubacteria bacterium]
MRHSFVRTPKYRCKVLIGDIPQRLAELLPKTVAKTGSEILNRLVQSDSVPLLCFFPSLPYPPHRITQRFKGYTSQICAPIPKGCLKNREVNAITLAKVVNRLAYGAIPAKRRRFPVLKSSAKPSRGLPAQFSDTLQDIASLIGQRLH